MINLYTRGKKGIYQFDLTVNGKRQRISTGTANKAEAEKIAFAEAAEISKEDGMKTKKASTMLLKEAAPLWLESIAKRVGGSKTAAEPLRPKTEKNYAYGWKRIEKDPIADERLCDITQKMVRDVAVPGSGATFNSAIRTLSLLLKWAKSEELILQSFTTKQREENERTLLFDDAAVEAIRPHSTPLLCDIYICLQDTGCRDGELLSMRIEDIDWTKKRIHIRREGTKTDAGVRDVFLTPRMAPILARRIGNRVEGWIFQSPLDKNQHLGVPNKAFARARKAAGLPKELVLHCFRHYFGTWLMAKTGNPFYVMRMMGHKNLESLKRYQHHDFELGREFIEGRPQLEELLHSEITRSVM